MQDRCSHGVPWESDCDACEAIGMGEQLKHIAEQARHCAEYYERNPAMSVMAIPDIYRAIQRLADAIGKSAVANTPAQQAQE